MNEKSIVKDWPGFIKVEDAVGIETPHPPPARAEGVTITDNKIELSKTTAKRFTTISVDTLSNSAICLANISIWTVYN